MDQVCLEGVSIAAGASAQSSKESGESATEKFAASAEGHVSFGVNGCAA